MLQRHKYTESELVCMSIRVPIELKKRLIAKLALEDRTLRVWVQGAMEREVGNEREASISTAG